MTPPNQTEKSMTLSLKKTNPLANVQSLIYPCADYFRLTVACVVIGQLISSTATYPPLTLVPSFSVQAKLTGFTVVCFQYALVNICKEKNLLR